MLGEIRDSETAQMAIRASLTGHLVLSTIHTNSAWGTVSRLLDMGVPSYLVASTLNLSVAQRLVRILCEECKIPCIHDNEMEIYKKYKIMKTFSAVGCENCYYTGYRGRIAIYEIIPINDEIADCIKSGISDIKEILGKTDFKSLSSQAAELLRNGTSSIDELLPILRT